MTEEIKTLLEDIQTWMLDNDYECGEVGGQLYNQISKVLGKES